MALFLDFFLQPLTVFCLLLFVGGGVKKNGAARVKGREAWLCPSGREASMQHSMAFSASTHGERERDVRVQVE